MQTLASWQSSDKGRGQSVGRAVHIVNHLICLWHTLKCRSLKSCRVLTTNFYNWNFWRVLVCLYSYSCRVLLGCTSSEISVQYGRRLQCVWIQTHCTHMFAWSRSNTLLCSRFLRSYCFVMVAVMSYLCICLWRALIFLWWPCAVGRRLKSSC